MSSRRSQLLVLALIVAAIASAAVCLFRPGLPEPDPEAFAEPATGQPSPDPVEAPAPTVALTRVVSTAEPTSRVVAPAGDREGHPHPITAEHIRIQRELSLIQSLNDALDLRDAPHLRALVDEYTREYPHDPNALGTGYARIADCLDSPGDGTRQAAQQYYDRERASTLRRYVRRVCLESTP